MTQTAEWHLEKKVSIGHILTTVMAIASLIAAYYSLDSRMTVLESRVVTLLENQVTVDKAQDQSLQQFRSEIRGDTNEINSKLDIVLSNLLNDK